MRILTRSFQLNIDKMKNYRQKVIDEAKTWVGTKYKHYSSVKGAGVDCGLFIMKVYENIGLIKFKQPSFYPLDWAYHNPVGEVFKDIVEEYCDEITKEEVDIGDIILYKFGKCLSHASIVIEDNKIIHSEINIGVKISNRFTSQWFSRERKYYTCKKCLLESK